jgi:hypothetical protein
MTMYKKIKQLYNQDKNAFFMLLVGFILLLFVLFSFLNMVGLNPIDLITSRFRSDNVISVRGNLSKEVVDSLQVVSVSPSTDFIMNDPSAFFLVTFNKPVDKNSIVVSTDPYLKLTIAQTADNLNKIAIYPDRNYQWGYYDYDITIEHAGSLDGSSYLVTDYIHSFTHLTVEEDYSKVL